MLKLRCKPSQWHVIATASAWPHTQELPLKSGGPAHQRLERDGDGQLHPLRLAALHGKHSVNTACFFSIDGMHACLCSAANYRVQNDHYRISARCY